MHLENSNDLNGIRIHDLVIPSIFAVIPLLRGNSDTINQSNPQTFSADIITKVIFPLSYHVSEKYANLTIVLNRKIFCVNTTEFGGGYGHDFFSNIFSTGQE